MNFKYEVANMDIVGENNTVIYLHYRVSASKEGCDLIPVRSGVVKLGDPTDTFIPFDEITKETAIQWLKESINCEKIEKELSEEIENFEPEPIVSTKSSVPASWR